MAGNFSGSQKQVLIQQLRSVLMQTELSGSNNSLYKLSQALSGISLTMGKV